MITEHTYDEQEALQLHERCASQWDAGVLPERRDIARLLALFPRIVTETIRVRQENARLRAEASTPLLLPSSNP